MALTCALIALAGTAVSIISLVMLHLLPAGLSPLRDPVSRYGVTKYVALYRVGTIALGVAALALAVALPTAVGNDATIPTTGLVVFGLAQGLVGWFADDTEPGPRSVTGQRHMIMVVLFYGGATVAAFGYSTILPQSADFAPVAVFADVLAWAMVVLDVIVLLTLTKALRGYRGLAERLLHVPIYAWMITIAFTLLQVAS